MTRHQNLAPIGAPCQRRPRSARRAFTPAADPRRERGIVGPDRAAGTARGGTAHDLGEADEARTARADHQIDGAASGPEPRVERE
jgi:hypothetical protein